MSTELLDHMNPMQRAVLNAQMTHLADLFLQFNLVRNAGGKDETLARLHREVCMQLQRIEGVCDSQYILWRDMQR